MNKYSVYDEKIINLAETGLRPTEISKELNIDSRRVIERLKINNINYFRMILLNKYEIETTIHKDNVLYIRAKSKNKFKEIVKKYATKDVLYKLGELLETS